MTPFEILQKHYRERDLAAREWKKKGGKVVGYFCTQVPEELILAAGFFPLRISGDPADTSASADKYAHPYYEGFVRSMFNRILDEKYSLIDYLIIPHSRDAIHTLYAILGDVKELNPGLKLPEMHLFDILHTRSYMVGLYIHDRVVELKQKLEKWSGKKITADKIRKAIVTCNESRSLLDRMAELRRADDPLISGTEALQIIGSSMFMLKEEHNSLLKEFLETAGSRTPVKGTRVFVEGSPMDNLQFYHIIESCGGVVVAEDNCWGNRYKDDLVATTSDPLEAIAERYQLKSPCPRNFSLKMRVDNYVNSAIEAKAKGAIFNIHEYDYAQTWETPEEIKACQEKSMPSLCLKHQQYTLSDMDKKSLAGSIGEFLKTL
jgi:benzoyl-CoA reductase/2-hydroxyglutaryl-CoA dehydratase subunit BcrC/BadD/HgdB